VDGVLLFVVYTDNVPMRRVEGRFEIENTKPEPIVVELEVTMMLASGKASAKQKQLRPVLLAPGQVKKLGLWQAPAALETTWKWKEAVTPDKPVVHEMDGVFLSRAVKPPPHDQPSTPAELHFAAWTTNW
jgi:hypothetical protein